KDTYIMNQENQVLLAKEYIEQFKFREKGYKTIYYLENDFIRALRFITPLLSHIGVKNVNEIVVDSTFETNQKRFELFAINVNHDGYGMPLAYLYLLTSDGTGLALSDYKNRINTRVQVLAQYHRKKWDKLSKYKKVMDMTLVLYEREIDNNNFTDAFDKLMRPLAKEINECQEALQNCNQQRTWRSHGKLAFWLC
ncbi:12465_t:CDS:2, partial [Cetraspora pellucida]